jgi:hypothetical protein
MLTLHCRLSMQARFTFIHLINPGHGERTTYGNMRNRDTCHGLRVRHIYIAKGYNRIHTRIGDPIYVYNKLC